jgi:hypothetical protein
MKFFSNTYDVKDQLSSIRKNDLKHYPVDLPNMNEIFNPRKGFPIYWGGYAGSGKSEVVLEVVLSWIRKYKWKGVVWLNEAGTVADAIADVAHKLIGKPFYDIPEYDIPKMTDQEWFYAQTIIDEHLVFINKGRITINEFYDTVEQIENEKVYRFDFTLIDPFTNLKKEESKSRDYYIEDCLSLCAENSEKFNRINMITNHIAKIKTYQQKEVRFNPIPMIEEWSNGQAWSRLGYLMYGVYRPNPLVDYGESSEIRANETWVICQKVKPKRTGRLDKAKMWFNPAKNQYYNRNMTYEQKVESNYEF